MAEQRPLRNVLSFVSKAAQCPNCFSFNHPEYLPEQKKRVDEDALLMTCATCGTPYTSAIQAA
jgi:RNase P subunit RPR2